MIFLPSSLLLICWTCTCPYFQQGLNTSTAFYLWDISFWATTFWPPPHLLFLLEHWRAGGPSLSAPTAPHRAHGTSWLQPRCGSFLVQCALLREKISFIFLTSVCSRYHASTLSKPPFRQSFVTWWGDEYGGQKEMDEVSGPLEELLEGLLPGTVAHKDTKLWVFSHCWRHNSVKTHIQPALWRIFWVITSLKNSDWRKPLKVPCSKQVQLEEVSQGHVPLSFEFVQGWRTHSVSGQHVPVLSHPLCDTFSLYLMKISLAAACVRCVLFFLSTPLRGAWLHTLPFRS